MPSWRLKKHGSHNSQHGQQWLLTRQLKIQASGERDAKIVGVTLPLDIHAYNRRVNMSGWRPLFQSAPASAVQGSSTQESCIAGRTTHEEGAWEENRGTGKIRLTIVSPLQTSPVQKGNGEVGESATW